MATLKINHEAWAVLFVVLGKEYNTSVPDALRTHYRAGIVKNYNPRDPWISLKFYRPKLETLFRLKYSEYI